MQSAMKSIVCPDCGPVFVKCDAWDGDVPISGICPLCQGRLYFAGDKPGVRIDSATGDYEVQPEGAGPTKPQSMLYEVCPHCKGEGGQLEGTDMSCCEFLGVVQTGATAHQLERLAQLDMLRQEAGISAAMLRDGRAKGIAAELKALRHACLAALGYLGDVSICTKEQIQKTLTDAVKPYVTGKRAMPEAGA